MSTETLERPDVDSGAGDDPVSTYLQAAGRAAGGATNRPPKAPAPTAGPGTVDPVQDYLRAAGRATLPAAAPDTAHDPVADYLHAAGRSPSPAVAPAHEPSLLDQVKAGLSDAAEQVGQAVRHPLDTVGGLIASAATAAGQTFGVPIEGTRMSDAAYGFNANAGLPVMQRQLQHGQTPRDFALAAVNTVANAALPALGAAGKALGGAAGAVVGRVGANAALGELNADPGQGVRGAVAGALVGEALHHATGAAGKGVRALRGLDYGEGMTEAGAAGVRDAVDATGAQQGAGFERSAPRSTVPTAAAPPTAAPATAPNPSDFRPRVPAALAPLGERQGLRVLAAERASRLDEEQALRARAAALAGEAPHEPAQIVGADEQPLNGATPGPRATGERFGKGTATVTVVPGDPLADAPVLAGAASTRPEYPAGPERAGGPSPDGTPDDVEYRHAGLGLTPDQRAAAGRGWGETFRNPVAALRGGEQDVGRALLAANAKRGLARYLGQNAEKVVAGLTPAQRDLFGQRLLHDNLTAAAEQRETEATDAARHLADMEQQLASARVQRDQAGRRRR